MNSPETPLHVVAGAGQIGPQVAERLLARGLRVRMLRRRPFQGASGIPAGLETASVDLCDPAAAAEAMRGAEVVYHCANPAYHRWDELLMPLTRGIVEGATRAEARLVALDNLYMYGTPSDGVMREDSPLAPQSHKGELRVEAAELMLSADRRGDLRVAVARASDYFGPGITLTSLFGDRFWRRLIGGARTVECLGDPDQPHAYSYGRDVADGLVTLGTTPADDAYGRVWHLPVLPAEPTRAWIERFAREAGRSPRITTMSPLMLKIVGLFIPEASGVPEMIYQWKGPFILDDSAFRARFGAAPTPVDTVVRDTVAWAREAYRRRAAA